MQAHLGREGGPGGTLSLRVLLDPREEAQPWSMLARWPWCVGGVHEAAFWKV
jgi:hypothetical protein